MQCSHSVGKSQRHLPRKCPNTSPQPKRHSGQFSRFCTVHRHTETTLRGYMWHLY